MSSNNNLNNTIAFKKIKHFCAYQERCQHEVKIKLISLGVYGEKIDEIIAALITENYLNESRFAEQYAKGKHNLKLWGKIKIKLKLKEKKLHNNLIVKALSCIDEKTYQNNLNKILHKRLNNNFDYKSIQSAIKFCMYKGYEYNLIMQQIQNLKNE